MRFWTQEVEFQMEEERLIKMEETKANRKTEK